MTTLIVAGERAQATPSGRMQWDRISRILLAALIGLIAFPVRFYPLTAGIDPSWAYAVNYSHVKGLIFGRDVVFTYGPLAWASLPMDLGNNLWQAVAIQIGSWLLFLATVVWFTVCRRTSMLRVLAFACCVLAGWQSFHNFVFAGPEFLAAFLALLLLGGAVCERHWRLFHAAACVIGVTLLFVKFSAGIMVLGAAIMLSVGLLFVDRRKALFSAIATLAGAPLLFSAAYLLYCPSGAALWGYVRSGFELSSGYNTAMSMQGPPVPVILAIAILLSWLLLIAVLYRIRDRTSPLAFAFLAPLFFLFKHSVVRQDSYHVGLIFAFAPLLWGIVLLVSEIGARDVRRLLPALGTFAVVIFFAFMPGAAFGSRQPLIPLAADRLPAGMIREIAGQPVGIFPHECAYAAANGLNFRPFPVLQSYSAYTPYLDKLDADFLEDGRKAPRYIVFDWQAIDGRHPLLDAPATVLAMYRHYDLVTAEDGHLLLRRKATPRFQEPRTIGAYGLRLERPFSIPPSANALLGRFQLRLTTAGKLQKFFFRIPDVYIVTSRIKARVPPEVITDGVPLNFMPADLEECRILFSSGPLAASTTSITITGPGARFFQDPVRVEILDIPNLER